MIKVFIFYFLSSSESVTRASSSDIKYKTMGVGRRVGKEKFVPLRLSLTVDKEKSAFVVRWHSDTI